MSRPIRLLALAALLTGLLAAAGCGQNLRQGQAVSVTDEGLYLTSGGLKYQVQISRYLNPSSPEDAAYLKGRPAGATLGTSDIWFAVFMRVENDGGRTEKATSSFTITDTQNNTFRPIPLNPGINSFAYQPKTLSPTGLIPDPNSVAGQGVIQGALILFKLNENDLQNRPLTLHIGQGANARSVELDL
jgi:hypothetical protein